MQAVPVSPASIETVLTALEKIGAVDNDPVNGFDRPAYSETESRAFALIREHAESAGLDCYSDKAANLIIETPGNFAHWIETGSHLDSVPAGGNYDGVAGVIAGLQAIIAIQQQSRPLSAGLRLRIWRGEESASFGTASIGSRAAFGMLPTDALMLTHQETTLAAAMQHQGADPDSIANGDCTIDAATIDAYIELHIEQGKVLESRNCDIGIVTAIRGSRRAWLSIHGSFDHSGATPMGSQYRSDANLAMAHMHVALDQLLTQEQGDSLLQTIGAINPPERASTKLPLHKTAISKVSGAACFSFEVRSTDAGILDDYWQRAEALMYQLADKFAVKVNIKVISDQPGIAKLDIGLQQTLRQNADHLTLSHIDLPSGAWHDAATVAAYRSEDNDQIPVAMIFVPCRGGISHSPLEYATPEAIARGTSLLATTMLQLAQSK